MKNRIFRMVLGGGVIVCAVLPSLLYASEAKEDDPKSRMKARAPEIVKLKAAGVVGESNRGYLAFVGEKKEKEDLVKAENKDRKTAHAAIAKKEKTSLEVVEKFMAQKRAQRAKPGEWLQDAKGNWYQKEAVKNKGKPKE